MSKHLSNCSNKRKGIRNVNEHYYAAVNPHWTIVPLLEYVVAKQGAKINQILFHFHMRNYIKWLIQKQKNMICIFGSSYYWVKKTTHWEAIIFGLKRKQEFRTDIYMLQIFGHHVFFPNIEISVKNNFCISKEILLQLRIR